MDASERESSVTRVLKNVWRNWAIACGAIMLPLVFALFTAKTWLPFIALAEIYILSIFMRSRYNRSLTVCSLPVWLSVRVLAWSAVAMLAVNILCTDWLVPTAVHLELYNPEIPFITCLIVFPVTAVLCALVLFAGLGGDFCRRCQEAYGYYAGDSIIGTLYYREARYQLSVLMLVSVLLGAVEYWYYFARYINSNLDNPDRFFFVYMPLAVYVISLVMMGGRYGSMRMLYNAVDEANPRRRNTTCVRFLIFCGNDMLLHRDDDGVADTPVETIISARVAMGHEEARLLFTELTGMTDFALRYCFTNEGLVAGANTMHYAVFVEADKIPELPHGDNDIWFNTYMLDCALSAGAVAPVLANELYRIHTITMAWKTYDRNGRRLYPIKHYRPTFRLGDLQRWTVDYDDLHWLSVARNNEDRRFFRLRALWDRITGVLINKNSNG